MRIDTISGFTADYGLQGDCGGSSGPDRVNRATVPAGQTLTVHVTPAATGNTGIAPLLQISLGTADEPSTRWCEDWRQAPAGTATLVSYTNTSSGPVTVAVAVGNTNRSATNLSFALNPIIQ